MSGAVTLSVEQGDILRFGADVVALKHAQGFFGADLVAAAALSEVGVQAGSLRPAPGSYRLLETHGALLAPRVLFVGVPPLFEFMYSDIRAFAVRALEILADEVPETRHVAMTMHGTGYGLDEMEAVRAQASGCAEAVQSGRYPRPLERISIVEVQAERVELLRRALGPAFSLGPAGPLEPAGGAAAPRGEVPAEGGPTAGRSAALEAAGIGSDTKPHAFVAMPFAREMLDTFRYGIQNAVHANGLLCERIDQEAFTGDVMERVKARIGSASIVIADLTGANPNVYLEVGYAWGRGRPTVLLAKDAAALGFDARGQRCLIYETIGDLEERLTQELGLLKSQGVF